MSAAKLFDIQLSQRELERFWDSVDRRGPDECWPWIASAKTSGGYGQFFALAVRGGRNVLAHRISYILHYGAVPSGRPLICHSCDNPPCINPAHLFAGTPRDNTRDSIQKGRWGWWRGTDWENRGRGMRNGAYTHPESRHFGLRNISARHPEIRRGEMNGRAVLTEGDVAQIRAALRDGWRQQDLAVQFGISKSLVSEIKRDRVWKHVA